MAELNSPADIEHLLEQEMQTWMQRNCSPEQIKAWVEAQLNHVRKTILLKLLGFDDRWGQGNWEIDHCNGRNGNSAAGDQLRQLVGDNIKTWLSNNSLKLPELPAGAVKELQQEYKNKFERSLREEVIKLAQNDAQETAHQIGVMLTGIGDFPSPRKD